MSKWIFGIGGMKCASTWIYQCLNEHPDICMSQIKEVKYFNNNYENGEKWYLKHFNSRADKARGEYTPTYLYDEQCAERMHRFCPDANIIVSIRNPIKRLTSQYKQLVRSGDFDKLNIEEAVKLRGGLLTRGLYYKHLKAYFELFGREKIIIIVYEEIAEDPEKTVRELYSRINVSDGFKPSVVSKYVSKGIIPKFAWMEKLRERSYTYLTDHGRGDLINLLVRSRVPELYRKLNKASEKKVNNKVFISDEFKSGLVKYYREDVDNLRVLTGLPLNQWTEFND